MKTKNTYQKKQSEFRKAMRQALRNEMAANLKAVRNGACLISQASTFALLSEIRKAIAPALEAKQLADDYAANGYHYADENQGYTADLQKYRDKFAIAYEQGKQTEPDLAVENEPRFAIIQECAKITEAV